MAHAPENGSPASMGSRGRAFLSLRRGAQVVSMEQGQEQDLELFQSHVAERLLALSTPSTAGNGGCGEACQFSPLSLAFLSKLIDALLSCEEEFRSLIGGNHVGLLAKAPADRAVNNLLDRAVKSLDVCNAVTLALHSLRHWHRHALIAASALHPDHCGEGALNRARRALAKLFALCPDVPSGARIEGSGSTCRSGSGSGGGSLLRGLSFSISRNWSCPRHMPPVPAHLGTPRGGEAGGVGMALAVYAMTSLLAFTMWALAVAVLCQDRGSAALPNPVTPRLHLPWAGAMIGLQDRIAEEWRMRRCAAGLLAETQRVQRCGRKLMEAVGEGGAVVPPEDVAARAAVLEEAWQKLDEGLGPLERQVREVFHRVIGSRAEVLRCVDQSTRAAAAPSNPLLVSS